MNLPDQSVLDMISSGKYPVMSHWWADKGPPDVVARQPHENWPTEPRP